MAIVMIIRVVDKEWYSLDETFSNAGNRQKSEQLQNYGKTPCI